VTLDPRNFDPMRHEWWPGIASMFAGEWTREAAMMDLRWHAVEVRVFGRAFPSRPQFMARWGWTERRVRDLLAASEWQDPAFPMSLADLRGEKVRTRSDEGPAKVRATSAEARTNAEDAPERSDERPAEVRSRSDEGPQARSSQSPITVTDHRDTQEAAHAAPSELTREPAKARTSDEDTLYAAYRGFRPRIPPTPTPDTRKHLRRILTEAGGIEPAGLYLAWTFQSQDERALQVQGKAPWPGGKVNPMLSLEELGRHIGSRMPMAEAWDARGRRNGPQAPPGQAPRPTRGTLASELFADDPDPAPRPNAINTTWSEA
jgi:hypothetical protein